MADPRFYRRAGPFRLVELAKAAGAEISRDGDPERLIHDLGAIEQAGPDQVTFLDNRRYLSKLADCRAGACILEPRYAGQAPAGMGLLLTPRPYRAYALIAQLFYPREAAVGGVHPTAFVHAEATVDPDAEVGAYAVVESGAEIAAGCRIGPHAVIGAGVVVGADSEIGPHCSLSYCIVGERCQIGAGARIGTRGFGFTLDPEGFLDVPQVGRVLIGDDVEVGANTTVDRGSAPDTVVGSGTRIDNLVQLGHNVQIGRNCVLVAQSGVAGSTRLEDFVTLAAQAGVIGHLVLGRGAKVAGKSGVMRNVPAGESVGGYPAIPLRDFLRLVILWQRHLQGKAGKDE